jgi:ABC-type uncharacterized transport system involved in gliding motility auxiliary subunit
MNASTRSRERGEALAMTLHVVLLVAVLAQLVYLASRHRARFDLTSDQLWSSTESTKNLVGKLDQQLVIEAYFSPKEKLPVQVRETRAWADSFLDELVQLGKGRVVVQRLDPNGDKAIADKAQRVGIKPLDLTSRSSTSAGTERHWQGLRLRTGAGKQRVIPQFAPPSSFFAEAQITPAIKEVLTETRRKVGFMEWPATNPGGAQQGGLGWNAVRTQEGVAKRYEFQNYKDEDGALLPADLETLFLFRPKDLTDRQKYVLDQFVVNGGTLVAFVDAAEYLIGPQRNFTKLPMVLDAAGSTTRLIDQLLHYGLDWKPKVVADMSQRAFSPLQPLGGAAEYFALPQPGGFGAQGIAYPYFFHAVNEDWSQAADNLAKDATGKIDASLAEQYRKQFLPGMPSDEFLFKAFKGINRGPGFYWPTWTGLRERAGGAPDLPDGVTGRVLLRSSPLALVEDPPQSLNPVGFAQDALARNAEIKKFHDKLMERQRSEPKQQVPLMVEVQGRFSSFFAGMDRPKRPSEIKEEEAKKAAAAAKEKEQAEQAQQKDDAAAAAGEKPNPDAGPQPADKTDAAKQDPPPAPAEPAIVARGEKPGRILLVGDSDFLRDDLVNRGYAQAGGPVSLLAHSFFPQLLDWLAEDSDLVALQSKSAVDRTVKLLDADATPGADPRLTEQALRRKTTWLRTLNVLAPAALLAALGLAVFFVRRAQKRTFLTSLS